MSLPSIPDPDQTMAELNWLHPEIYRAFEHGVFKARNYFETEGAEYDVSAFSTLVRLQAKDYLRKRGLKAVEIEEVNMCGLSLKLEKYTIKMWKSDDSQLPVPGKSEPKQEFYQQPLLFPNDGGKPLSHPVHLAVLWNLNEARNFTALWLSCPKFGNEKSAEAWWCKRIPDPATTLSAPKQDNPPDLNIQPKKITKKEAQPS